ncbi:MAG: imidazole glycerol phosphate synthase subunit HisH [Bryobacteraceae bacterium]|nr:imidazole glycerol phosphate synthase subunit HisH [Bryobacteraceae bacterium]
MIAILDYGAGNLRSVQNTLGAIGCEYELVRHADGLLAASKIILPGVGHFGQMMRALDDLGVRMALKQAIVGGTPFLGICLGMQGLFERSEEAPDVEGLGIYQGEAKRFSRDARVPHMGWNTLTPVRTGHLVDHPVQQETYVYFAHSYYVPVVPQTSATCTYTVPYTAVLECGNVYGVQFHPEKSGSAGMDIVRRFVELC